MPAVALVVLDGWGLAPDGPGNAVSRAETPVFDELWEATRTRRSRPRAATSACRPGRWATPRSATSTSAPARSSSRTWPTSTTRSPTAPSSTTRRCATPAARARESRAGACTPIALVSDGGVHSGWAHIEAVIELAAEEGVPDLVLHALTDGRDTLPRSAPATSTRSSAGSPRRADRHGRRPLLGMDRDKRWDRTKHAYDAIVHAEGQRAASAARRSPPPTRRTSPTSSSSRR